ncbi:MAG: hypothetical protein R6V10_09970 [bacterium]
MMYPDHPWQDHELGRFYYEMYLSLLVCFNVKFVVHMQPFIDFCAERGMKTNQTFMKVVTRLSAEHLPQRIVSLKRKVYPARYPAGYVRPLRDTGDMLEHVSVREKPGGFSERAIRANMQELPRKVAARRPRLSMKIARVMFSSLEVKDHYALLVSRNPLKNLDGDYCFHSTHHRTCTLNVPYGEYSKVSFGGPLAFGTPAHFEPFLLKLKTCMEDPNKIPEDVIQKPYKQAPPGR